jgi:2-hydroxy-6-oxonona-2,4-dienedioate hydrolase
VTTTTRIAGLAGKIVGAGDPLILLHGGMGSWNHWTRNIDALAARFAVHLLDLPGCGDSPTVAKDIPDDDYVGLVVAAVGEIAGERPVNLAGFSFGGVIAALTAARMGARIHKLSLLGVGGFGKSPVKLDLRKIPPDKAGTAAVRDVLRHNLQVMMIADAVNVTEETIDLHYANVRRTRFDGRRFSLGRRMVDTLARITCPVQVIWGERDVLPYPNAQARVNACRATRPDIRADIVPDAGHWVQYEAPDAVNKVMLEFF